MQTKKSAYRLAILVSVFCLVFVFGMARGSQEATPKPKNNPKVQLIASLNGADLFQSYYANCHGTNGKGDGPLASFLDTKVSDLTTIAKRTGGIFLATRVRAIIAGDELIKTHGTREMPIWGPIFHQIERGHDYGEVRLQNVTRYVESLQER
jgi:hypothetical protein